MNQQKRLKRDISGWLVINKPLGLGSTDAVGKARWLLAAKKAGHSGTLDPLATGVLAIAFGEATKIVPYVQDGDKIYRFSIVWGAATTTDDREGALVATSSVRPDRSALEAVLPQFTGSIQQVPPQFSAVHVDGARAYDLARAGQVVDLLARTVRIDRIEIIEHARESSLLEMQCGSGTYVRALARDLAEALGSKGHVGYLERTRSGPFAIENATDFGAFVDAPAEERAKMLLPIAVGLREVAEVRLDAGEARSIRLGNPVLLSGAKAPIALEQAWASHKGEVIAVGSVVQGHFRPKRVLLPNQGAR